MPKTMLYSRRIRMSWIDIALSISHMYTQYIALILGIILNKRANVINSGFSQVTVNLLIYWSRRHIHVIHHNCVHRWEMRIEELVLEGAPEPRL